MEKEKATIYDFVRMCGKYHYTNCKGCPMWDEMCNLRVMSEVRLDKTNEIILKWCKEHPIKTRQSEFLKAFPNAPINNETVGICPLDVDKLFDAETCDSYVDCTACKKEYWLAEVEENE